MKSLPNLLTSARLVLALFMFMALAAAAGAVPGLSDHLTQETQFGLERWAIYAFVISAVTDFFDGWLARKLNATSVWGAILDPIGDKVLVCGAVVSIRIYQQPEPAQVTHQSAPIPNPLANAERELNLAPPVLIPKFNGNPTFLPARRSIRLLPTDRLWSDEIRRCWCRIRDRPSRDGY
jgi:hypothetical protein